ncbi:MAG: glycoside hydrolase family 18 protein [Acidobacteriota bacterium]|nr:glycoside hydrolase family 18 protein [Acidobacteriota bacterium]
MLVIRLLFVLCLALLSVQSYAFARKPSSPVIIAYVFPKDQSLSPDEIAAEKLSRINYAFANIQNGEIVQGFAHDRENFQALNALKQRNPKLQILISVGGWTWSGAFSDMALTRESRRKFIDSAVSFIEANNLDGIDIDWEYPGLVGAGNPFHPADKQNYTLFLKEMRKQLDGEAKKLGRPLFTSVATGASPDFLAHTEMKKVARYVDTVNLMSYDYYEPTDDKTTGHHAPLFTNEADPKRVSADASVKNYLAAGVPSRKLVLGIPFYGHAWSDVADINHGLFQPAKKSDLDANYNQIVQTHLKNGFVRYWDETASAPYLYNAASRTFISYEDVQSIRLKCQYVLKHKLGGIMFWDYEGDSNGELLNAIDRSLGR